MTDFESHPSRYQHWQLKVEGAVARLALCVQEDKPFRPGYRLKLNSYDLGVDIELQDAVQRLRFEHPEVKVAVVQSANPRIFCAGANINMLATSSHPFKVNFCKFTNETRCSLEDASQHSGIRWIAALNGTASGGGYELAEACDEIYLIDDGNSAVSLPEVPLLGVLPGTGGLTRLVDKRQIRRDRADVFSTTAEGLKARKAKDWGLIDGFWPRSKFDAEVAKRAVELAGRPNGREGAKGIVLAPIAPKLSEEGGRTTIAYRYVTIEFDRGKRVATLTVAAPDAPQPLLPADINAAGSEQWALRAFRELDDAILRLRLDEEDIGLVLVRTRGDAAAVLEVDEALCAHQSDWLVREITLQMARALRRLDLTAKSLFALADEWSCFAGSLLEMALACDRVYMKHDAGKPAVMHVGPLSAGLLPMPNGLSRLQSRFLATPAQAGRLARERPRLDTQAAYDAGLVTSAPDELDWDEELRVAIEERLSLSPDALTGMEASLRFGGPETADSKIYGRLSAWQNWIFTRPNATGEHGALKLYGQPERPRFDWRRT